MAETSIEWTDATWNPVAGCTIVSPGCTNCYAMRMAARLDAMGMAKYRGLTRKSGRRAVWTGEVTIDRFALEIPLGWKKPRFIFVNSMSDLFHENVPPEPHRRCLEHHAACSATHVPDFDKAPGTNGGDFATASGIGECMAWNQCRKCGVSNKARSTPSYERSRSVRLVRAAPGERQNGQSDQHPVGDRRW